LIFELPLRNEACAPWPVNKLMLPASGKLSALPSTREQGQRMVPKDNGNISDETSVEITAALFDDSADGLAEPISPGAEDVVAEVEGVPSGSALLLVKRGPSAGARFLLDRDVTSAGRHPDSGIFLDDITVSRCHAEFLRDKGEFRVVDAGSLNGTYVNRQPVDSAVLANHDEIQIGKFRLVFVTPPTTG
jgi:pSer/pThr/pTyr-binding forkhead associated (FHA) protein